VRGILISGAFAFLFSLFATPAFIKFLARKGYGQQIRDDGPKTHHVKRGTPTMGGIVLIAATVLGYLISHVFTGAEMTVSALLVIGLIVGLGLVGYLDDWLKVVKQRSLGLKARGNRCRSVRRIGNSFS
jgi:phospho-N-acetylmuramoyl-pentapeptide-transferase